MGLPRKKLAYEAISLVNVGDTLVQYLLTDILFNEYLADAWTRHRVDEAIIFSHMR